MIPDNVTLIVKAPNQQVEDQNIECQSSWTVRQLKGHLSEVYPSKPKTEEQKIIYSGQLLDDNTILKDVLRTYESQIAHTMHLVCTPTKRMPEPQPVPQPSSDGLRHRTAAPADPPRAETRQNDQNHSVEMAQYLSSLAPPPADPAALASHMMLMHQAYLQYMQHYANMWGAGATVGAPPAPPAAEAPPAPAAPPADDEPEPPAQDWLDQLYAASRLAILFSLVYLYGSPARLLLVLLLAAAGYLHQIGFFRDLHVRAPAPAPAPAPQPADQRADQPAGTQEEAPPPSPAARAQQQSLLAVTWMIFTSFFASLIPDAN